MCVVYKLHKTFTCTSSPFNEPSSSRSPHALLPRLARLLSILVATYICESCVLSKLKKHLDLAHHPQHGCVLLKIDGDEDLHFSPPSFWCCNLWRFQSISASHRDKWPNFGCSFAEKPIHDEILNSMKYGERLKAFKSQDLGSCFEWWLSFPVPNRPARDPSPLVGARSSWRIAATHVANRFDDHPLSIIVPSQLKPWINVQSTAKCTPSSPSIHHHLSTSVFTIAKAQRLTLPPLLHKDLLNRVCSASPPKARWWDDHIGWSRFTLCPVPHWGILRRRWRCLILAQSWLAEEKTKDFNRHSLCNVQFRSTFSLIELIDVNRMNYITELLCGMLQESHDSMRKRNPIPSRDA